MNKQRILITIFLCFAGYLSVAQQHDSLLHKSDSLLQKLSSIDTLGSKYQKKLDSLSALKLPGNAYYEKLDSLRNEFSIEKLLSKRKSKRDSLRLPSFRSDSSVVLKKRKEVDSLKQSLSFKIESLKAKAGDPLMLQRKTDSLQAVYNQAIGKRLSAIQQKGIKLTDGEKKFLEQSGVPGINLNTPSIPGLQLPENGNMPDLGLNTPKVQLPKSNLPGLPSIPGKDQVGKIQDRIGEIKAVSEKAGSYAEDIKQVKEEGLSKAKNLDKAVEDGVKNIDEVQALQGELSGAEKLKQLQQLELDKIKGSQNIRDHLSTKSATDKILANEKQVKAYMDKMGKYKKKFDNLPDMRYLPRVKRNAMKGRPLKERIVPGILFQILKESDHISWYLAPEVLYKFSGTFSAGASGLYRFQYTTTPKIVWTDPVYGYKMIGQAKTYKNFYLRTEFERTSLLYPDVSNIDIQKRIWQSNWLIGLGRTQKISNRLNGHFWAFYNLTRDPQDIFRGRVILKTGIQFNLVNYRKNFENHITEKMKKQRDFEREKRKLNENRS